MGGEEVRFRNDYSGSDLAKKFRIRPDPGPEHWKNMQKKKRRRETTTATTRRKTVSWSFPSTEHESNMDQSEKRDKKADPMESVLWIRIRMFSGLLDPDPDPSIIKQKL